MQDKVMREDIIRAACSMHIDRLTVAKSGNISVRNNTGFLITPSGVPYENLQPQDIVQLDSKGNRVGSGLVPSSEWRIHADVYHHRPEVNAVVHAHSPAATALSVLRSPVPAFHYMVALFGGNEIPCSEYATFGTQALSDNIIKAMAGYKACLMANHGMLAVGSSLPGAYGLALELESLCAQYSLAKQLGDVIILSDEQMNEAKMAFVEYGQKYKD